MLNYCSNVLVTTMNNINMGCTTLLHPVFNNLEQVIVFCSVAEVVDLKSKSIVVSGFNTCRVALCLALSVTQCYFKEFLPAEEGGGGRRSGRVGQGGKGGGQTKQFYKNRKNIRRQGLPESRDRRVNFLMSLN